MMKTAEEWLEKMCPDGLDPEEERKFIEKCREIQKDALAHAEHLARCSSDAGTILITIIQARNELLQPRESELLTQLAQLRSQLELATRMIRNGEVRYTVNPNECLASGVIKLGDFTIFTNPDACPQDAE